MKELLTTGLPRSIVLELLSLAEYFQGGVAAHIKPRTQVLFFRGIYFGDRDWWIVVLQNLCSCFQFWSQFLAVATPDVQRENPMINTHTVLINTCYTMNSQTYIQSPLPMKSINCQSWRSIQWNLVIKRSDITKPSYKKVILLVPALYIYFFFLPWYNEKPDITK